jgi:hypothetical protein
MLNLCFSRLSQLRACLSHALLLAIEVVTGLRPMCHRGFHRLRSGITGETNDYEEHVGGVKVWSYKTPGRNNGSISSTFPGLSLVAASHNI